MVEVLADTFLSVQRAAWEARVDDPRALDRALAEARAAGERAWPGVEVDGATLAAFIADRAPDEVDPIAALRAMNTDGLYLACACMQGDRAAIEHFDRRVLPAAEPAVARIDADATFVREVLHEVRVRLLVAVDGAVPKIATFLGRGPLESWVCVVAMRTAYGEKRRRPGVIAEEDAERLAALPFEGDDAELARIRAEFAAPFRRAFAEALASLGARDRNVLRLYVLEGVSSDAIGRMYRVHRATVARWIARIHEQVLAETKKRMHRELGISAGELESFMRVLSSRLEISIATVLSA